jgi:hypothetical protein
MVPNYDEKIHVAGTKFDLTNVFHLHAIALHGTGSQYLLHGVKEQTDLKWDQITFHSPLQNGEYKGFDVVEVNDLLTRHISLWHSTHMHIMITSGTLLFTM